MPFDSLKWKAVWAMAQQPQLGFTPLAAAFIQQHIIPSLEDGEIVRLKDAAPNPALRGWAAQEFDTQLNRTLARQKADVVNSVKVINDLGDMWRSSPVLQAQHNGNFISFIKAMGL